MMTKSEQQTAVAQPLEVPAEVIEVFEKAHRYLRESYGTCPSVADLMQYWLTGATSWDVVVEVERSLLGKSHPSQKSDVESVRDESSVQL